MRKFLFAIILLLIANTTYSDDRRFSYIYESSTLSKNQKDVEVWTTYRGGRDYFYSRFDNRLEFEIGLTKKLQTALYLNFTNVTEANQTNGDYETEFDWEGISSEWKYQALNKYQDGIGFAPYLEIGLNTRKIEVETKLIFDKNISKKFVTAFNIVAEYEWEFNPAPEKTSKELKIEFDFGLAYDVSNNFSVGLEARNINTLPDGEGIEYSALYIGPNISYRTNSWFFTLTYLPQLPALKRLENLPKSSLILNELERNNVRMLLGFTL